MNQQTNARDLFDSEALAYHAARPQYPELLFDKLVQVTGLAKQAKVLEIGPGTGQATVSMASRNFEILAVELGERLAACARNVLQKHPNVNVLTGAFETVELPLSTFDLVYAATAFHWIKPEYQFQKPHSILKPNGHLAVIHTEHVSDEIGDEFFFASRPIYDRYWPPGDKPAFRLPLTKDLVPLKVNTSLFALVHHEVFPLAIRYSAEDYAKLLSSYSPTLALTHDMRLSFLEEISDLIVKRFGGCITKQYAMTLSVARRL